MSITSPDNKDQDEDSEHSPIAGKTAKNSSIMNMLKNLLANQQAEENSHKDSHTDHRDLSQYNSDDAISEHENELLDNILKLRSIKVDEVMVPRADIIALDIKSSKQDFLKMLASQQFSRIPVYMDTLDEVLGTVHLKDIVGSLARGEDFDLKDMLTDVPIVSPFMPVLDLLLTMRDNRRHMVMVVDEFGGIDGLVTIGDIIEAIVGEMEDEHDINEPIQIQERQDGSLIVDARVDIEDFEGQFGEVFTDEEREESDTMGGLAFKLAGRVPVRGEVLTHESGLTMEIVDADRRRVKRLRVSNIPEAGAAGDITNS
ncbi:MAG: hemolysin family protein [Micavibrio sp.]|nr:hemolysin family protein [Micavibrio sp.]